jgi:hypothetical protein
MTRTLTITEQTYSQGPSHMKFRLKANGIPLEVTCSLQEFKEQHEKTMEKVNSNFLNSLRVLRYADDPRAPFDPAILNKWTSSSCGVAVKVKAVPIPEFVPFAFT